ncbi:Uncharacterised protein [uncultured archaeon]|nr:Uncharacterised protein [uncultured archaeon]
METIIKSWSLKKAMTGSAIQKKEISRIERAAAALDFVFGEQKKQPQRYWPEDEETNLDDLEIICDYKFIAEDLKLMGIKISEMDIYRRCLECTGHDDRGCAFRPDYYGNNED